MTFQETLSTTEQFKKFLSDPPADESSQLGLTIFRFGLVVWSSAFNNLEHTLARRSYPELIECMGVIDRVDYSPKRRWSRLSPTSAECA